VLLSTLLHATVYMYTCFYTMQIKWD
jgi:hypothetical protein